MTTTILNEFKETIKVEEADTLTCGIRQDWFTARNEEWNIEVTVGVYPWVIIHVKQEGKPQREFRINMAEFIEDFVNKLAGESA